VCGRVLECGRVGVATDECGCEQIKADYLMRAAFLMHLCEIFMFDLAKWLLIIKPTDVLVCGLTNE